MNTYSFELPMKVRDYECDIQGIVNNANYQHYLEHTRHEYLLSLGLSFAEMHESGYDYVVSKVTLNYKTPLRSRDEFLSRISITHDGIRYLFHQEIVRCSDQKLCLRGTIEVVCLHDGKLTRESPYDALLLPHLNNA